MSSGTYCAPSTVRDSTSVREFFSIFNFLDWKFEPLQRPSMEDTWAHIHLKY